MSCSIQNIVKLGAMLPLFLGTTIFNPAKASALDVTQIPLLGSGLQRGLSIEPSLKLFDRGMSSNNLQVCVLSCSPMPNGAIPTSVSPPLNRVPSSTLGTTGGGLPPQVMQIPNQILQPNSVIQQAQPLLGIPPQPLPQALPQSLPPSPQIPLQPTTLQQVGQVLLPQVMQGVGH